MRRLPHRPRSLRPPARLALLLSWLPVALPARALAQDLPPLDPPRPPQQTVVVESEDVRLEALTFDGAVQRALARNPTNKEAIEEVRRVHALMEEVRAASLPTLTGNG